MILHPPSRRRLARPRLLAAFLLFSAVAGAADTPQTEPMSPLSLAQAALTKSASPNPAKVELTYRGTYDFAMEPKGILRLSWPASPKDSWSAVSATLADGDRMYIPCQIETNTVKSGDAETVEFAVTPSQAVREVTVEVRLAKNLTGSPYNRGFVVEKAKDGSASLYRDLMVVNSTPIDWPEGTPLILQEGNPSVVVQDEKSGLVSKGQTRVVRDLVDAEVDVDTVYVDLASLGADAATAGLPRAIRIANGAAEARGSVRTTLRKGDVVAVSGVPKPALKNYSLTTTLTADVPPAAADSKCDCAEGENCRCLANCGKAKHVAYIPYGTVPDLFAPVLETGPKAAWLPLSVKDGKVQHLQAAPWVVCLDNRGGDARTVAFFDSATTTVAFSPEVGGKYVVGGGQTKKIDKENPVQQFSIAPASLDPKDANNAKSVELLKKNLKPWLDRSDRKERLASVLCLDPANCKAIDSDKLGTLIYDLLLFLEPAASPAEPPPAALSAEEVAAKLAAEEVRRLRTLVQALESLRRQVEDAGRPEDQWLELLRIRTRLEIARADLERAVLKAGFTQADFYWSTQGVEDLVVGHPFKDHVPLRLESATLHAHAEESSAAPADESIHPQPEGSAAPLPAKAPEPPKPEGDVQPPPKPAPETKQP